MKMMENEDLEKKLEEILGKKFDDSRKLADNRRKKMSREEFHHLRALCKRDLFFLSYSILGNTRLSTNLHGHLCTHVRNTQHERFHSYLLPRGHFKSTIITIAHTIQLVLPYEEVDSQHDEDSSPLPWPSNLGPDCRVLIAHETSESASRFLFAITNHFLTNPLLMALFPDAIPEKRKHRINKQELELPRSDNARGNPEPTVDTLGVGAKSQGKHYNYIKLDDIYGDKARDSATESEGAKQWFDNIQSFFSVFAKDHLDLVGTRYSIDDVYAHAFNTYGPKLIQYARKVEETKSVTDDKGKITLVKTPIFPEEFTTESLAILRKNKKVFAAQYENDPYEGESGFSSEWKKFFYWHTLNTILIKVSNAETRIVNVRDLDVVILIDPGVGSSGGLVVTGADWLGNIYCLIAIRLDLTAPAFTDLVFRLVTRWQPRTVVIESDIFASTYEHWWKEIMPRRGVRFHITPVTTKKKSKEMRINGLTSYAEAGKLFINEAAKELNQEWNTWGKSKNIHILDALAYGPEVWRPGYAPGQRDLINSASSVQQADVDPETGYSTIRLVGGYNG